MINTTIQTVFHLTAAYGICTVLLVMQRLKLRCIQVKTNKFKEIVVLFLQVTVLEFLKCINNFNISGIEMLAW